MVAIPVLLPVIFEEREQCTSQTREGEVQEEEQPADTKEQLNGGGAETWSGVVGCGEWAVAVGGNIGVGEDVGECDAGAERGDGENGLEEACEEGDDGGAGVYGHGVDVV